MTDFQSRQIGAIDDRFRMIADTAPVLIWMANADMQCEFVNRSWLEFTGESLEKIVGNGWKHCIHPEDIARLAPIYETHFAERKPYEVDLRLRRKDGEYRWVHDKGVPRFEEDGSFAGYVGSLMDIHDTKLLNEILEEKVQARTSEILRQAQELKDRKEFSDTVFNASVDVMVVYGKQLEFLAVNDAAKKMYGFDDSIIGKKMPDVFPSAVGGQGHSDVLRALSGETVHNAVYKSAVRDVFYEDFMIPLKKNDEVYATLVIARDITERISSEVELKQLNDRLTSQNIDLQSSNEDLESFNYIASHDLQEPLRKVAMFAGRILEKDGDKLSDASRDYFARLTAATSRMQNLIQSLLEYSRMNSEEIKFGKTNLNRVLKEVMSGLEETIHEKNASIRFDELPTISAVSLQIQQLLHNLVSNALKYSKPDVAPEIAITAQKVKVAQRGDREFWKISISDNGIGFDNQYKHKIFELFQRLHGKMEYEGTGIGLAICRKIATIHQGYIEADSVKGQGATFDVYIPVKI